MGAKKLSEHDHVFTGINVALSEISKTSDIGVAMLKKALIAGSVDFGYATPCGEGK